MAGFTGVSDLEELRKMERMISGMPDCEQKAATLPALRTLIETRPLVEGMR